jgi:mRNA interferase RelE/StbE
MYEIRFTSSSEKFLKKLKEKDLILAYKKAISSLKENPHIGQLKKGDLSGVYGIDVYYKGINYELAYLISEENKTVVILLAGTRENFYNQLKRLKY